MLRETFPVGILANQLARNGASALSVLTDEQFFEGSLTNPLGFRSYQPALPAQRFYC